MSGDLREVEEHLADVLAACRPLAVEELDVLDALGRTLATDAVAVHDIPAFENSAMDGYAVRHADVAEAGPDRPVRLDVVGDLPAGSPDDPPLGPGQAVRIMTGSVVPTDADTIVPFEDTVAGLTAEVPDHVEVVQAPRASGVFVRGAASDLAAGDVVLRAGRLVGPRHVAAARAAGIQRVQVSAAPRVAILATGTELVSGPGPLTRGQVPESNAHLLAALSEQTGATVVHVGTVRDDDAAVVQAVQDVVRGQTGGADVVVLTGGVSAGAYDAVKSGLGSQDALEGGSMRFGGVRMQPGKPQGFGVLASGCLLFGLPGNPVSTAVSWEVFVRPALLALQGRTDGARRVVSAVAEVGWGSPAGRRQYVPVVVDSSDPDRWRVRPTSAGHSGSHLVGSLAGAEGYAVVPAEVAAVEPGDTVAVMLIA